MSLRSRIVGIFFLIVSLVLIVRIYFLSIGFNTYFEKLAQRNITRTEFIFPVRGHILDRFGEPIVINELGFSISIKLKDRSSSLDKELEFIMKFLPNLNLKKMKDKYLAENSAYNHDPIVVVDFVPYDSMQKVYSYLIQNPNIRVNPNFNRLYKNNTMASHIIGYVGSINKEEIKKNPMLKDIKVVGKSGLEKQYNDFLQGSVGRRVIKVDALNKEVGVIAEEEASKRNDLQISIDIRLQKAIDKLFVDKNGVGIVMDARTGEILAAGSYPEYNLNDFIDGISYQKWNALLENPYNPLLNKIVNGLYPPGSVIKMGMALGFLEFSGINERTLIDTPEHVEFGGRKFRDWKRGGHGESDMFKAIRESVDVYFYKLSQRAGIENLSNVLSKMGFGQKSGVDLPNEFSGILPSPEWKMRRYGESWFAGDTIVTSIGQGAFLSTPIQIARYTALLGTGYLPTPHFAIAINEKKISFKPKDVLNNFQKSKLNVIAKGMYQVCNSSDGGTAYNHTRGAKVQIACKTGTAQVVGIPQEIKQRIKESDMDYFHRSHGWITAFVPYKNPKYVITILVEHGGGSRIAGPILVDVVNSMYDLGYFK